MQEEVSHQVPDQDEVIMPLLVVKLLEEQLKLLVAAVLRGTRHQYSICLCVEMSWDYHSEN